MDWNEKAVLGKTLNEVAREGRAVYLVFDEVQNLKNWAPQLKFLVNHSEARVLVTGSSALRIEAGRDSLAGRITTIESGVLSLTEETMRELGRWAEELPAAITVTDAKGTILAMNARSRETFTREGGGALIGSSVFDCHPEKSRGKLRGLFETKKPNHYTIRKKGQRKIIHQLPWFENGAFAGFVEISIPVPDELPHFERG